MKTTPALPGFEQAIELQQSASAERQAQELTLQLITPKPSISKTAGEMERCAPLFQGTGADGQAQLFTGKE